MGAQAQGLGAADPAAPAKVGGTVLTLKPKAREAAPIVACDTLLQQDLVPIGGAGSRIEAARIDKVAGVEVCRVSGVLAPAVRFDVNLPTKGWTLRYLQMGCGGLCGQMPTQLAAAEGCAPLMAGTLATGATNMGHQGPGGAFGRDPAMLADFAHRAQHVTALAAKQLIRAFYGRAPAFSYFSGCSDGGREALIAAQRYPEDFNGIVAGAPALNFQAQNGLYHAWQVKANTGLSGKPILLAHRLPLLHQAVLRACDGLDGVQDGLLADPRACLFDPASIQCPELTNKRDPRCLSAAEARAAALLYDGPRDPKGGERLTAGGPQFGSELGWAGVFVPTSEGSPLLSAQIAKEALDVVFEPADRPASLAALRFDHATFALLRKRHPLLDATQPDLQAFIQRGGKLILWHGWSDPHISPINTIAYHQALQATLGFGQTQAFARLYLLPGVAHCAGGEGPSVVDFLTPMMDWVERGREPDRIEVKSAPGATVRARPAFPYPAVAKLQAGGDPNRAEAFLAGPPLASPATPLWAGSGFYAPQPAPGR
jgi:feruloyl esterase